MPRTSPLLLSCLFLGGCFVQLNQEGDIIDIQEPFDRVVVDVETGSVEIFGGAEASEVDWDKRWGVACPEVDVQVQDGVLYIEGRCPAGAWTCSTDFRLEVPAGVDVQARVVTGELRLEQVGRVEAELTTGDVEILGATGEVGIEVTTGDIVAHGLDVRTAWAEVTTGSVQMSLEAPFEVLDVEAVTGSIDLRVPQGCYDLDLDVVTGQIDTWGVDCGCPDEASIRARVVTGSIDLLGE